MYREVVVGGSLLVALLLGIPIAAKANELAEAQTLYEKHCSTCHGLIVPDTAHGFNLPEPPSTAHLPVLATSQQYLVFAPPYGPPLRGVYARVAGSVKGFSYSRAFKEALQGVCGTTLILIAGLPILKPGCQAHGCFINSPTLRFDTKLSPTWKQTARCRHPGPFPPPSLPSRENVPGGEQGLKNCEVLRRTFRDKAKGGIIAQHVKRSCHTVFFFDLGKFVLG
jgi:hypothetical protein